MRRYDAMSKGKLMCWLLISILLASVVAVVAWRTILPTRYTAKAVVLLAPCEPHILSSATEKYDPVEFEMFRDNQVSTIKSERVISAALRDPNLKDLQCLKEAEMNHDAIQWLTDTIHVEVPAKNNGVIYVSATVPADKYDPSLPLGKPAREIVNAVVNAYMKLVIEAERERREIRLDKLQKLHVQKENDVRKKREDLKQDEEKMGVADERGMQTQTQLAVTMYTDFQRDFQRMKAEQRVLVGNLRDVTRMLDEMENDQEGTTISELEVVSFLNGDPVYRDLRSRLVGLEPTRPRPGSGPSGTRQPQDGNRIPTDYEAIRAQLDKLCEGTRKMIRDARIIALRQEKRRVQSELEITTGQLTAFEKQVEQKKEAAESAGRITISAQMARADVENVERVLRNLAEEEARLRVELQSPPRVTVYLAELPESPD